MSQKQELRTITSNEENKRKQIVNTLFDDKLVDDIKPLIISHLTDSELDKAYTNVAMTSRANFKLFKPNFKSELVKKLMTCVAMGEQYEFCPEVKTQKPTKQDIKEVTEKRKIFFIATKDDFQICYCSDNGEYVREDVNDKELKYCLTKYKESLPLKNIYLSNINQTLTKSGIRTQQDKAERLLKTSPELMLEEINFTDCSGRTFANISAFKFLLWAWDTRYGVNMMLNCLPHNQKGIEIAGKLLEQYDHHKEHGVTYTLEGKTITEKHFDFSVLINALQVYLDKYEDWSLRKIKKHWCTVVGKAQCYLPAHVMQHYCDPNVPFSPLPKFDAKQFIRTLNFYNYDINQEMAWAGITHSSDLVLGLNFGINQCWEKVSGRAKGLLGGSKYDLEAIKNLCEVRKADYLAIPSALASLFEKKASCVIS